MSALGEASQVTAAETDLAGWRKVASKDAKEGWQDRAQLAAAFLRPGDAVCDLGAGAQPLRSFLPEGSKYIPVDCVDALPGTYLADFNTPDFTLPDQDFNVLTALGVVNWLKDEEAFLNRLSTLAEGKFFIFTYDLWGAQQELSSLDGCMAVFSRYVRTLTPAIVFRRRVFFTGTLGRGETNGAFRTPATNVYLKYLRPQEYLVLKLLKLKMMPRWLA
jgi:hypothetical protein